MQCYSKKTIDYEEMLFIFSENLKTIQRQENKTAEQFGAYFGYSRSSIERFKRGESLTLESIFKICSKTGYTFDDLLMRFIND